MRAPARTLLAPSLAGARLCGCSTGETCASMKHSEEKSVLPSGPQACKHPLPARDRTMLERERGAAQGPAPPAAPGCALGVQWGDSEPGPRSLPAGLCWLVSFSGGAASPSHIQGLPTMVFSFISAISALSLGQVTDPEPPSSQRHDRGAASKPHPSPHATFFLEIRWGNGWGSTWKADGWPRVGAAGC